MDLGDQARTLIKEKLEEVMRGRSLKKMGGFLGNGALTFEALKEPKVHDYELYSIVQISHPTMTFTLKCSFSQKVAENLFRKKFDTSVEAGPKRVMDLMLELTNLGAGEIQNTLRLLGYPTTMSVPLLVEKELVLSFASFDFPFIIGTIPTKFGDLLLFLHYELVIRDAELAKKIENLDTKALEPRDIEFL